MHKEDFPPRQHPFTCGPGRFLFFNFEEWRDEIRYRDDAKRKGIADGDMARVVSHRGEVPMKARISTEVKPGILYCTFHFPEVLESLNPP